MTRKIFISYRRDSAQYQAGLIMTALRKVLPVDNVFMDVDSIPLGRDFKSTLKGWVDECEIMLALISPGWAEVIDPATGKRRLENPNDFVRIEVAAGLARGIPVVPIILDKAELPKKANLPRDLRALVDRQAEFVRYNTFDTDVARLIAGLRIELKPAPQPVPPPPSEYAALAAGDPAPSPHPASLPRPAPSGDAAVVKAEATVQPFTRSGADTSHTPARNSPANDTATGSASREAVDPPPVRPPEPEPKPAPIPARVRDQGRLQRLFAILLCVISLPATVFFAVLFQESGYNFFGSRGDSEGGNASGALVFLLILAAILVVQRLRNAGPTAISFHWLALIPPLMIGVLFLGLAAGWRFVSQDVLWQDPSPGLMAGALVALGSAALLRFGGTEQTQTALNVYFVGGLGAVCALIVALCMASRLDLIQPYYGNDGPMFTGFAIAAIVYFICAFLRFRSRRREAPAGERWLYFLGGGVSAFFFAIAIYQAAYPGYDQAPSTTPYTTIALVCGGALIVGWGLMLQRMR